MYDAIPELRREVFQFSDGTEIGVGVYGGLPVRTFLYAGAHGTERRVIKALREGIRMNFESGLQPKDSFAVNYLLHPHAVAYGTDFMPDGTRYNRQYRPGAPIADPVSLANALLIPALGSQIVVALHSDYARRASANSHRAPKPAFFGSSEGIYIYDYGNLHQEVPVKPMLDELYRLGIDLFSGTDDESDPDLGYEFRNGYRYFEESELKEEPTLEGHLLRQTHSNRSSGLRMLTIEMPQQTDGALMDQALTVITRHLLF